MPISGKHVQEKWRVDAAAPTRIDLAGGTLDLWPLHFLIPKATTVNVAVSLDAEVTIRPSEQPGQFHLKSVDQSITVQGGYPEMIRNAKLPLIGAVLEAFWTADLPALDIHVVARSPAGAGLGGSSCLAVTLAKALWRSRRFFGDYPVMDDHQLVARVQDAEARVIRVPTGCQDYWAAVRGGVNMISFEYGRDHVLTLPPSRLGDLGHWLILCYSGQSRASAGNNWEVFKAAVGGDTTIIRQLAELGELACQCAEAIVAGAFDDVLKLSEREWKVRQTIWPTITTPETRRLDSAACEAGAVFSRVCGAGGGGVMAVFAEPTRRNAVVHALEKAGGSVLQAEPAFEGVFARARHDAP